MPTKTRTILAWIGQDEDSDRIIFLQEDDDVRVRPPVRLEIAGQLHEDMGAPTTVTVTIEPGDTSAHYTSG